MRATLRNTPRTIGPPGEVWDRETHPYILVIQAPHFAHSYYPSAHSAVQSMIAKYHRAGSRGMYIGHLDDVLISEAACDEICRGERQWVSSMLRDAGKRAKMRGEKFPITAADLHALVDRQGLVCAVTGIPFEFEPGKAFRRPWAPSLDRIDSTRGYTSDNIRLVCVAANLAMNEWGEDVLVRMAVGVMKKALGK